jgi:hypothetical protein
MNLPAEVFELVLAAVPTVLSYTFLGSGTQQRLAHSVDCAWTLEVPRL